MNPVANLPLAEGIRNPVANLPWVEEIKNPVASQIWPKGQGIQWQVNFGQRDKESSGKSALGRRGKDSVTSLPWGEGIRNPVAGLP